jgi:colanic acid/amylovoran biosynthesis glycosyltransferase
MLSIAYLANEFPCAVEPYVGEEIEELRRRGTRIVTGSVRKPSARSDGKALEPEIVLGLPSVMLLGKAAWLCIRYWGRIAPLIGRVLFHGDEGPFKRLKAIAHTFLGACYAVALEDYEVDHIHVHHGYFGSWIGMTAARLLDIGFSMTLHGSDLLLHGTYLDVKLENCKFCLTVSEYNRRHILDRNPAVDRDKVEVARMGVLLPEKPALEATPKGSEEPFTLVAVGRLHPVKDHAFLVQACAQLHALGVRFECFIAGEGPERGPLMSLIRKFGLDERISLLGHVPREQMQSLYDRADVVVLTSRSEGIPLVLMEAMARRKIVLAPQITGIPELVIAGKSGFLYEPGNMEDFVGRLLFVHSLIRAKNSLDQRSRYPHIRSAATLLQWIRHGAHVQVRHNFNRQQNLESFADLFLRQVKPRNESIPDENFVLQQI